MSNEQATELALSISREWFKYGEQGVTFGYLEDGNEEASAYDFLEDVLDIEYRIGSDGKYRSAKVLTGWGGPNVWIDTAREQVAVAWYCEPVFTDLPHDFIAQLDEALSELWSIR